MTQPAPRLADTVAAALLVGRPARDVRDWAHRGLLTRRGKDGHGRTLYDLREVQALAARINQETR